MTVLVSDSFNRANSTTTLGTTDSYNGGTATAWQALKGTWGISSNQGYCSSPSGNDNSAVVDVGTSDVTITCTMADWGSSGGIIFRAVDMSNYYRIYRSANTNLILQKFVSGTLTTLTTLSGQTFPLNDTVKFVLNGSTIQFYKSGTLAATVTDSSVMGTKHGLHHQYIDQYGLWDNFQIEDLATSGTTYSGAGTAQGTSSLTSNETVINSVSGSSQGTSTVSSNDHVIYSASGVSSGSSSLSSGETVISQTGTTYSGSGTSQGSSSLSGAETIIYKANGTSQGFSSLIASEIISLIASGISQGYSTIIFVDTSNQIIGAIMLKGNRSLEITLKARRDLNVNLKGGIN